MRSSACSSVGRRERGAAEEFETAAAQRAGEKGEAFVVEAFVDQPVERGIARDGDAGIAIMEQVGGNFCMLQQRLRRQPGPRYAGQNAGYEAYRDCRWASGRLSGGVLDLAILADYA
jgi:hypothetical protein